MHGPSRMLLAERKPGREESGRGSGCWQRKGGGGHPEDTARVYACSFLVKGAIVGRVRERCVRPYVSAVEKNAEGGPRLLSAYRSSIADVAPSLQRLKSPEP